MDDGGAGETLLGPGTAARGGEMDAVINSAMALFRSA